MSALTDVLQLAALPFLATLSGGLLGDRLEISRYHLGLALHVATGVVFGIVGVEILPRTLSIGPPLLVILAFVLGGFFFIVIDRVTEVASSIGGGERTAKRALERAGERAEEAAPPGTGAGHWVLAIGIGIDLITDGLMITVGYAVDPSIGLLLAAGSIIVEFPEGFATLALLREEAVPRATRMWTLAILTLSVPVGALLGLLFVGRPIEWQVFALAFTAGMLATLMIEEMTPQSHKCQEGRYATVGFLGGFSAFALFTVYLG